MGTVSLTVGPVTAYGFAKSEGYTGTKAEFAEQMANAATNAQTAATAATNAHNDAVSAAASAATAMSGTPEGYATLVSNVSTLNDEIADKLNAPSSTGTSGQALLTDGNGNHYWGDVSISVDSSLNSSSTNPVQNRVIKSALDGKQNTLTFDNTPTASSSNPVKSSGIKTALDAKQDSLTFDTVPTESSANPVTSGAVKTAVDTLQSNIDTKVNKPTSSPNGTAGQLLRTKGDGSTEWVDEGQPTDAQTAEAVSAWLDEHPEATTTVEDGSITLEKLASSVVDGETASGVTTLTINNPYTKEVSANVTPSTTQTILHQGKNLADFSGGKITSSAYLQSYDTDTGTIVARVLSDNSTKLYIENPISVDINVTYIYSATYGPGGNGRLLIAPYDSDGNLLQSGVSSGSFLAYYGGYFLDTPTWSVTFSGSVAYVKLGFVWMTSVNGTSYESTYQPYTAIQFEKGTSKTSFTPGKYDSQEISAQTIFRLSQGYNLFTSASSFSASWSYLGSTKSTNAPESAEMSGLNGIFYNSLGEELFSLDNAKNFVSVKSYGAVGDGTTDDTAAIQSAINANRKVYFPNGTYKITSPIALKSGGYLQGDTNYSTKIQAVGCDAFQLAENCETGTVKNFVIVGDGDSSGYDAIRMTGRSVTFWIFDSVQIQYFQRGASSALVGSNNNIYFLRCKVLNCTYGFYFPSNAGNQINNIVIRDSEVGNCTTGIVLCGQAHTISGCCIQCCDCGILLDNTLGYDASYTDGSSRGIVISGVYMEQIVNACIHCIVMYNDPFIGFVCGLSIIGCYLNRNFDGANSEYACIKIESQSGLSIYDHNTPIPSGQEITNLVIIGNNYFVPSGMAHIDLGGMIGRDSIVEDGIYGGTNDEVRVIGNTCAKILGSKTTIKKVLWMHNGFTTGTVTVTNSGATLANGASVVLDSGTNMMHTFDVSGSCATYPCSFSVLCQGVNKSSGALETLYNYSLSYSEAFSETLAPGYANGPYYNYSSVVITITSETDGLVLNNVLMNVVDG